jgi:hypothetical protein
MPVTRQPAQRTGIGQLFLGAGIESRPFAKVGDVGDVGDVGGRPGESGPGCRNPWASC